CADTPTFAQSAVGNVYSFFSSPFFCFRRLQASPKRPPIFRLLIVVERSVLEAARQRQVLLRDSFRERIELFEIADDWQKVEPTSCWERKYIWRKRLGRFPQVNEDPVTDRVKEIVALAPAAIDVVASRHGQTLRY